MLVSGTAWWRSVAFPGQRPISRRPRRHDLARLGIITLMHGREGQRDGIDFQLPRLDEGRSVMVLRFQFN